MLLLAFVLQILPSFGALTPATNGELHMLYSATFSGKSTRYVGNFDFSQDWGNYSMDSETFNGVVYQHQLWGGTDLMNIFSLSNSGDEMGITYVYCNGASVTYVYSESFEHEMVGENAGGSCQFIDDLTDVRVVLPPLTKEPNPSQNSASIVVSGSQVSISNSVGWVDISDGQYNVTVFSTVDCSTCGSPGWYELHSFLYSSSKQKACFGIFYLTLNNHNQVALDYTICIPDLAQSDTSYTATWSGSLSGNMVKTEEDIFFSQIRYEGRKNKTKYYVK